jgi:hypothetical protein
MRQSFSLSACVLAGAALVGCAAAAGASALGAGASEGAALFGAISAGGAQAAGAVVGADAFGSASAAAPKERLAQMTPAAMFFMLVNILSFFCVSRRAAAPC